MFGHYIDVFECHSSRFGHQMILVWECLQVAQGLGRYHRFIKRGKTRDWMAKVPIADNDARWDFSTVMSLLGDARDPTYAHPLVLGQYFDQVYHQGRFPGELPKRRPGQARLKRLLGSGMTGRWMRYVPGYAASMTPAFATAGSCHLLTYRTQRLSWSRKNTSRFLL